MMLLQARRALDDGGGPPDQSHNSRDNMDKTNTTDREPPEHEPTTLTRTKKIRRGQFQHFVPVSKSERDALRLKQGDYVKLTLARPTPEELEIQAQREAKWKEEREARWRARREGWGEPHHED